MVSSHVFVAVPVAPGEAVVVATPYLDEADAALDQPSSNETFAAEILGFLLWVDFLWILFLGAFKTVEFKDVCGFLGYV